MKKIIGVLPAIIALVLTISLYLVFYASIESKPDHAGFWLILALGMSLGVTLTWFMQRSKKEI